MKIDNVAKWAAIAGGIALVAYFAGRSPQSGEAAPNQGQLREKALGCANADTLAAAQERLNTNNDWMPAAGLVAQGACHIFDPGDTWRLIERGYRSTLVYVTKNGVPHRVYVSNSKLRS